MINSKKILSIMAVVITTYCSTMPVQTCAMQNISNSEKDYDFLQYKDITFFDNVPKILQDIFEFLDIYYIMETRNYIFIYECDILEPLDKCGFKKYTRPCLSNHGFEDLREGLKDAFYGYLKYMLEMLIEDTQRNIFLCSQKERAFLKPSDKELANEFVDGDLEKNDFKSIKSDINEYVQYILDNNAIDESDITVFETMDDFYKSLGNMSFFMIK